jgi:5-bromo-4-chloroindolyl phosphate hydrolysis protein
MMLMDSSTLNLLLQIPLAGVVVFVVVVFLKHLRETQTQMITFMTQQAETNRQFLATQREQMNAAIGRMAEELKMMRENFAEYRGVTRKRNRNV